MKKFIILIPCYNDWKSLFKLLNKIDIEISKIEGDFSVLIVDDCSTERMEKKEVNYQNIKSIKVLNMAKNQGHTRSNATGIKYLSEEKNFDYVIVMDGDGEDRPEEIRLLVDKVLELKKENISIVARRVKRSEGLIFTILYNLHKLITLIFTGQNMNFGHYCCLTRDDVILISNKKSLWCNFSSTVKKFTKKLDSIPCIRGKRYVQPSKMSFVNLVIHSFSILAIFKYQVLIRSILFILVLLFIMPNFLGVVLQSMIIIFTLLVFIISRRESSDELAYCKSKIKGVINLYNL